ACAPMALLAPGLFSATNVWPSCFCMPGSTERAVMSDEPPGTNGTITVTGLSGYEAACAAWPPSKARLAVAIALIRLFTMSPGARVVGNSRRPRAPAAWKLSGSVDPRARLLHRLGPLGGFLRHELPELGGRHGLRLRTQGNEALAHGRVLQDLRDIALHLVDDGPGSACRRQQAEPAGCIVAVDAGLRHRGDIGQGG